CPAAASALVHCGPAGLVGARAGAGAGRAGGASEAVAAVGAGRRWAGRTAPRACTRCGGCGRPGSSSSRRARGRGGGACRCGGGGGGAGGGGRGGGGGGGGGGEDVSWANSSENIHTLL